MQHGLRLSDEFRTFVASKMQKGLVAILDDAGLAIRQADALGGFVEEPPIMSLAGRERLHRGFGRFALVLFDARTFPRQ